MAQSGGNPRTRGLGVGRLHTDAAGTRGDPARLPAPGRRRRHRHADRLHRGLGRGGLRPPLRPGVAGARQSAAHRARPGPRRPGLLPQRLTAADRASAHPRRARRREPGDRRRRRRRHVRRRLRDLHRPRGPRRRRLPAQTLPPRRPAPQTQRYAAERRRRAQRPAGNRVRPARRGGPRRTGTGGSRRPDADRCRAARRRGGAPAHPVDHRLVESDGSQPARHPARKQLRRAGLPLVREGDRHRHGLQQTGERPRTAAKGNSPHP